MTDRRRRRLVTLIAPLAAAAIGAAAAAESVRFEMQAASDERYSHPHDVVLSADGKLLYVADLGNDRVAVLDAGTLEELGSIADGEVSAPHDVAFDAAGRLLVADTGNGRIAVYQLDGVAGRLVASLGGNLRGPEGVVGHADGRVLATGAWSNNLVVFADGEPVREVGGFSSPHDIEIAPSGELWVADANADRLVRLDADLAIDRVLEGDAYGFRGPRYMDFDRDGRLFVADKYSNRVRVISPDGTMIAVLGSEQAAKGEGVFHHPEGVEIRGNDVWFSDTYNDRIVRYRFTIVP